MVSFDFVGRCIGLVIIEGVDKIRRMSSEDRAQADLEVVDEVLEALRPILQEDQGEYAHGALLAALMTLRSRLGELPDDICRQLGLRLDVGTQPIEPLAKMVDKLFEHRPKGPGKFLMCAGLTCTMHGAARCHEALQELSKAAPSLAPLEVVHCLGHCDHGPSFRYGQDIYGARAQKVERDERGWREDEFFAI